MLVFIKSDGSEHQWHLGDKQPPLDAEEVSYVYADCDELHMIRSLTRNLRDIPDARGVEWAGDDAKFIFLNIVRLDAKYSKNLVG